MRHYYTVEECIHRELKLFRCINNSNNEQEVMVLDLPVNTYNQQISVSYTRPYMLYGVNVRVEENK